MSNLCVPLENMDFTPNSSKISRRHSFLRRHMTNKEIDDNLVFVDAEFTEKNANPLVRSPVSVTLIDYHGNILLDTLVTPRNRVFSFGQRFDGLRENDLRGRMDEYSCIRNIRVLLKDKILVGHGLHMGLTHLNIDPNQLSGIRDLSAAYVFEKNENLKER